MLPIVTEVSGPVKGTVYTVLLLARFGLIVQLLQVSLTVVWARARKVGVVLPVCLCVLVWLKKYAINLIRYHNITLISLQCTVYCEVSSSHSNLSLSLRIGSSNQY